MSIPVVRVAAIAVTLATTLALTACSRPSTSDGNGTAGRVNNGACIKPDANARNNILTAIFEASAGDTVLLCEGKFDMPTGLLINSKPGLTLKGAGMKKTFLNFAKSDSAEGINASYSDGLILQDFTVEDTPGNGIRIFRSNFITMRGVRARWHDLAGRDETDPGYTPRSDVGAYALYPVETRHILMENCEAHGASDAGVYVGQSSDIIVRNCLATYNVAGYEFENTYRAIFENNVATKNTGGFLIFDLPDLRQYGEKNIVRNNKSFNNNTENFAPIGNIVGLTPRGTGMLILASDQLEIYGNEIYDNDTIGIAMVNFGLVDNKYPDLRYDFFPEGVEIHSNTFRNNGSNPQQPNADRGVASALPLLLRVKNFGRGADIVWDGGEDTPNGCTEYPKDKDGVPLNESNPNEKDRYEARVDERGRPNWDRSDKEPTCKYNAWKFNAQGKLKKPENGLCITNNKHDGNPLTTPFLNAKLNRTDFGPELAQQLITPGSTDLAPHNCDLPTRALPVLKLPYVPVKEAQRPSDAEVQKVCSAVKPGEVNWAALEKYNCPELSQYGLFSDPKSPLSAGNGKDGVMPYELNSTLFTDYASKYRVIFLPPTTPGSATAKQAKYQDSREGITATLDFPVGTVISKTFTFRKEDADGNLLSENVVETRLLIKRKTTAGVNWVGLPYVWKKDASGNNTKAVLSLAGDSVSVSWDYRDPNPNVKKNGARARYTGSASQYTVPAALNCISCHGGDDREAGSAPIGPKARLMDRGINKDLSGENQLAFMVRKGWLDKVPTTHDAKSPVWDLPGSTGQTPGSAMDVHLRVRAYLEVNCMHCHNPNGGGSNSGLFLDSFRTVDKRYGICKKPVAAGRGSGGFKHDIVLGQAGSSILPFRVGSAEAGIRMPSIARTVVHGEASALINDWVDNQLSAVNNENDDLVKNEENCNDSELPILVTELLPGELLQVIAQLQKLGSGGLSADQLAGILQGIAGSPRMSSADQRREQSMPKRVSH
jgi:parallel beta-helix repeat protein